MKNSSLIIQPLAECRGSIPASNGYQSVAAPRHTAAQGGGTVLPWLSSSISRLARWGATALLATLAVTAAQAVESSPPRLEWTGRTETGAVRLNLRGSTPAVFALEATTDFRVWTPVATNVLFNGQASFVDPAAASHARRFYRARNTGEPPYVPGEVLVRWSSMASASDVLAISRATSLQPLGIILTSAMQVDGETGIYRAQTTLPVHEAVRMLTNNPAVEVAEPNWIVTHQTVSNDPKFLDGSLWGMYGDASSPANAFGSQAAEAWARGYTGSRGVYVGVIDEGVQITHPDLAPNIWTNPNEIPGNGVDDDGDGYVDDVHGWDFYNNDSSVFDGLAQSPAEDAHGTHVAGTIGAVGGNAQGVAGVNWNVTIIPAKFLGPYGGFLSDAIRAVDYFTDLKRRSGLNIVALNNSWGGGGYSKLLHSAIIRAAKANILFVAAAGNNYGNNDLQPFYPANYNTTLAAGSETPASYNSVIAVTALDRQGAKAPWANQGAQTVHLGAPGVAVVSTVPWLGYASYDGTSMATPHVTGAAALYASTHPGASAAEIRQALLSSALPTASLAGKTTTGGRLNLSCVIDSLPTPSGLTAEAGSSSCVTLRWNFSAANSTTFTIEGSTDGISFRLIGSVPGNARQYSDCGLAPETKYWYRVQAGNDCGASAFAGPVSVTTPAPPAPPVPGDLTAEATTESYVTVRWSFSATNVTAFRIEGSTDGINFRFIGSVPASAREYSDYGIAPLSTYWYRVQAVNNGSASDFAGPVRVTTRPPVPPVAPSELTTVGAGPNQINLTWRNNASNASEYRLERAVCGGALQFLATLPANATFFADTAANGGQCYSYRVSACNGGGCNSADTTYQPALPAAPSNVSLVTVGRYLQVTWTDNAWNETGYKVQFRRIGGIQVITFAQPANSTTLTIGPMPSGSVYSCEVWAVNESGESPHQGAPPVTFDLPPPYGVQATVTGNAIGVVWSENCPDETGFSVVRFRHGVANGWFTVDANVTSFKDTGLPAGRYRYEVSAIYLAGNSAPAASAEVAVIVSQPQLLTPTNGQIGVHRPTTLDWQDVPGATAYRLVVDYLPNDGSGSGRQRVEDVTVTSSTFTSQNLGPGRNYYWKVRAIYATDFGPWSDEWHFATRTN